MLEKWDGVMMQSGFIWLGIQTSGVSVVITTTKFLVPWEILEWQLVKKCPVPWGYTISEIRQVYAEVCAMCSIHVLVFQQK
jgi:hypothetical protein